MSVTDSESGVGGSVVVVCVLVSVESLDANLLKASMVVLSVVVVSGVSVVDEPSVILVEFLGGRTGGIGGIVVPVVGMLWGLGGFAGALSEAEPDSRERGGGTGLAQLLLLFGVVLMALEVVESGGTDSAGQALPVADLIGDGKGDVLSVVVILVALVVVARYTSIAVHLCMGLWLQQQCRVSLSPTRPCRAILIPSSVLPVGAVTVAVLVRGSTHFAGRSCSRNTQSLISYSRPVAQGIRSVMISLTKIPRE